MGAIFQEANKSGIGVVIRNSKGLILAPLSELLPQAYTVVEAEALAAARALQFAAELDFKKQFLRETQRSLLRHTKRRKALSQHTVCLFKMPNLFPCLLLNYVTLTQGEKVIWLHLV